MALARSRKGIFFTLIAIMLMTILVIAFTPQDNVSYKDRIDTVNGRVDNSNEYVKRLKYVFVEQAVASSARDATRALVLFENKTTYLPNYDSVNTTLIELMMNGSINGTPVECFVESLNPPPVSAADCQSRINSGYTIMKGKTFFTKLSALTNVSKNTLNINSRFSYSLKDYAVLFYQSNETGPWQMGVNISLNYSIDSGLSYWNVSQTVVVFYPVSGLLDPLYLVNATDAQSNEYVNRIIRTNITVWNNTNLTQHVRDQKYAYNKDAPSLYMRLYGNLSNGGPGELSGSECCGIESPVNPVRQALTTCHPKSYIDWCYYSSVCLPDRGVGKLWNITGVTTYAAGAEHYGFQLDTEHAVFYNVSNDVFGTLGVPVTC